MEKQWFLFRKMVRKWWMSKWFSTSMWVGYCLWEETPVRCDRWLGGLSHYIPLFIGFQPSKVHDLFHTHPYTVSKIQRPQMLITFSISISSSIEIPKLTHTQINHITTDFRKMGVSFIHDAWRRVMIIILWSIPGIFRGYSADIPIEVPLKI